MGPYRIAIFHNLISGGAKRSIYEYTRALTRRGHQIDLFTLNDREEEFLSIKEYAGRVSVHNYSPTLSLGDHTFLLSPLRSLEWRRLHRVSREVASEIESGKYDIAFIHNSMYIQCPMVLRYIQKIPRVYYCHETFRFLTEEHPGLGTTRDRIRNALLLLLKNYMKPLSRIEKRNIRCANMVLTNSYFTRENLRRAYGIESDVCYQGVDTEKFRPVNADRENFVLSVGQLTRWKAQDFLVESLSFLPVDIRPTLVLVYDKGNRNYIGFLKDLADARGVELELRYRVTDEELVRLYNRSAAFVYSPIREPFGFVPLEAMACGTPVVAVLEGGVREALRNMNGGTGVSRDKHLFAEALKAILVSDELRAELSAKGRKYVLDYWTWEKAAERLEAKFDQLIERI